ncbi:MAG: aminotransferase class V-fold PLP-dependent enzyme, partial [Planctomycetota bacterium JB042]
LEEEPSVRASVEAGADVVMFSGDKLLCGPQAGLIVGRRDCVDLVRSHPLYRAVRPGKLDLASLEATLLAWRRAPEGLPALPLYEMLGRDLETLDAMAGRVADGLDRLAGVRATCVETEGFLGSGSAPVRRVASRAVALDVAGASPDRLADALRRGDRRVHARIDGDRVLLDVRTVFDEEIEPLIESVAAAAAAWEGAS